MFGTAWRSIRRSIKNHWKKQMSLHPELAGLTPYAAWVKMSLEGWQESLKAGENIFTFTMARLVATEAHRDNSWYWYPTEVYPISPTHSNILITWDNMPQQDGLIALAIRNKLDPQAPWIPWAVQLIEEHGNFHFPTPPPGTWECAMNIQLFNGAVTPALNRIIYQVPKEQ